MFLICVVLQSALTEDDISLPLLYILILKQSDCGENLCWDWAEKAQAQMMHKNITVKICWCSRGAMQNSDDQDMFLLLHLDHKCHKRSYHTLCLINTQWNAVGQEASCLLSKGGTVMGSHTVRSVDAWLSGIVQEPRDPWLAPFSPYQLPLSGNG